MTIDNTLNQTSLNVPVDPEHGAFRLSMVLLFVVLLVASYIIVNLILPAQGINILGVILSLAATFLISQQVEGRLKQRWPSGRVVQVDERGVRILNKDSLQTEIDAHQQVNVHMWRFKIDRRARVPKGWFVVACALEQENVYLPVYTFMSPEQVQQLKTAGLFTVLLGKKESEKQGVERDLRLAGQQRRLHIAENQRWMSGAEMSSQDFENFIARLQALFPKWMP